jgi:hypothetical protein
LGAVRKTPGDIAAERIVSATMATILMGYGWLVLLNEGVTIYGKSGRTTHLSGAASLWYAAAIFLAAGGLSFCSAKSLGLKSSWAFGIASIVLLHPVVHFLR